MNLKSHEWLLAGLDGGHLLAFLAAIGTLRTAQRAWAAVTPTLRWTTYTGTWRPVLSVPGVFDSAALLEGLDEQLKRMNGHAALAVGDNLDFDSSQYRALANAAQTRVGDDPTMADFLGAFASDAVHEPKGERLSDTAFRTMRGAGHQHFIKTMRGLVSATSREQLEASLFSFWRYAESGLSLRWDFQDDRRYALRWAEPSGDPTRSERGANRLALEALPLFPVQPTSQRLETTGFRSTPKQGTFFTWPVWQGETSVDVVRSLVALRQLQDEVPPRDELNARGIVEIYRCQRIALGKFRNFTPALPV